MTLCLTFDDGLKSHAEIAAPMLKSRGWSGAFNIPTAFMDPSSRKLSPAQIRDLELEGHEDNLMDWDDVRKLLADGHEVYPHTHDHVDLAEMDAAGEREEIDRQIRLSVEAFRSHTGISPAFFCLPHYSTCPFVDRRIRTHGMEVFNCGRANFGGGYRKGRIAEFIRGRKRNGWLHFDISVHGISKATGGWEPFDAVDDFIGFLDEIKEQETQGVVQVVPYSSAHRKYSPVSKYLTLFDRIVNRASIVLTKGKIL